MSLPSPSNPFDPSHDPREYIARPASEEALGMLARLVAARSPGILLYGPAGIGKSMLLGVLRERLACDHRIVYASVSASPEPELSHRILGLLGEKAGGDPTASLVACAARSASEGKPLLLLIDHANGAPIASSRQLLRAAEQARPDLSVVYAVADAAAAGEFASALADVGELAGVAYDSVMNEGEIADYLKARLACPRIPSELRERLDANVLRWLAASSSGLPRAINQRATDVLQRIGRGEEVRVEAPVEPPVEPPVSRPTARPAESFTQPVASLGGGLLGSGARRENEFSRDWQTKFGPGYLAPSGEPSLPAPEPTAAPDAAEPARAATSRPAGTPTPNAASESASSASASAAATRESRLPEAPAPGSAPAEISPAQPAASPPSRALLGVAALVAAAIAGGFLAGRMQLPGAGAPAPSNAPPRVSPALPLAATAPARPSESRPRPVPAVAVEPSLVSPLAAPVAPAGLPEIAAPVAPDAGSASDPAPQIAAAVSLQPLPVAAEPEPMPEPRQLPRPALANATTATPEPAALLTAPPRTAASTASTSAPASLPEIAAPTTPDAGTAHVTAAAPEPGVPTRESSAPEAASTSAQPLAMQDGQADPSISSEVEETGDPTRVASPYAASAIVVGARSERSYGLEPIAWVRLRVEMEPGSTLSIDGESIGVAPFADLILAPGPHTFAAQLPDGLVIEQLVDVSHQTGVVEF